MSDPYPRVRGRNIWVGGIEKGRCGQRRRKRQKMKQASPDSAR